jgi:energy-coupling factor transporter transmembrane protein EcfT
VRFIRTEDPDPVGALLMILLAFLGLYLSGVLRWVFSSYLLVMFPGLIGMALAWVLFGPTLGGAVLLRLPVYSGTVMLGISLSMVIFVAVVVCYYLLRRSLFWGIVGGIALAVLVGQLLGSPSITLARFSLFRPLTILVSEQNLIVAITKALGYGAMMLVSLLLVMTSRDIEIIGVMRQLRVPYVAAFFVSTMLRSLNMALFDYSTIRQAQAARGVSLKQKNILQVIADRAYIAVPLTATMLRRSSEVGDAALIRGFSMQTKDPTEFYEIRPFVLIDWIIVVLCIALLVVVLAFDVNITETLGLLQ